MATLTDGIALLRIAEEVADLGAAEVLTDANIALIRDSALDYQSLSLLDRRLNDEEKTRSFLERIVVYAEKGPALPDEEEPKLAASLAALGTVLVSAAADQPTGVFEAVAAQ
jgi:hypothetical protein